MISTTAARIPSEYVERAKATPVEVELARRGVRNLKRQGGELIGPCPQCGGHDRFGVNIRKQIWGCRQCGTGGDVIALVRHLDRCDFQTAIATLAGDVPRAIVRPAAQKPAERSDDSAAYERRQHEKAAWLWRQRKPIAGTSAESYLHNRGIMCPLPATLGYLAPTKPDHHPAMVAAFGLVDEPEPGIIAAPRDVQSVHMTLIKADGSGKADVPEHGSPKFAVGSPGFVDLELEPEGQELSLPIILAPPTDMLALAVTEGIEDALALHQALGIGAWAAYSADAMPALAKLIPSYIECVTVEAHPDAAGQRGAAELAKRLRERGIEVFLRGGAT